MKNREVAGVLRELADSMELLGEDRYRVANYRDAATRVEHHHEPIEVMAEEQRVEQLRDPGVRLIVRPAVADEGDPGCCLRHGSIVSSQVN